MKKFQTDPRHPVRHAPDMEYYGMDSEDWRRLDDYWNELYGEPYPGWPHNDIIVRDMDESFSGLGGPVNGMGTRNPNVRQNYSGAGPRNDKRSDERILEEVHERLSRHPLIDATNMEVSVQDGEVILRGTVDYRETKRLAEHVAESVSGVRHVRNELRIQAPRQAFDRAA